jgi:hypothetical protein
MLNELLNVILSADTSNFSGAVTRTPSVKFNPETAMLCEVDATLAAVENAVSVETVEIVGRLLGI